MAIQLFDRVTLGDKSFRITGEGYLVADVRAARTGIQIYKGHEVGKPEMDDVRVYRPEVEVFKKDAMESFTSLPVTLDHPPELVDNTNWKKFAVGFTGESVARDGGFVRVPLAIKDVAAINAVKSGKRELSMGYTCDLQFGSGTTPDGKPYDAVQKDLHGNHLAIVSAGRAGSECRVGDQAGVLHGEREMTLKTITVDGIPVEVTDAGAQVIATLQKRCEDTKKEKDQLVADHAKAVAAKDIDLAKKDAEIEKLKGSQMDAAKLDKLVADRADLLAKAKAVVSDFDGKGLTDADIRRKVVATKIGDAAVKDRSDDYVAARFDILVEDASKGVGSGSFGGTGDAFRDSFLHRPGFGGQGEQRPMTADQAWEQNVSRIQDAWKGDAAKGVN
jgi:hypothetical protein